MRPSIILPVGLLLVTSSMPPASRSPATTRFPTQAGPIHFEPVGADPAQQTEYLVRGPGMLATMSSARSVMTFRASAEQPRAAHVLGDGATGSRQYAMTLVGSNQLGIAEGEDLRRGSSNYFIGNDSSLWRRNVPHYGRVRFRDVYQAIDLVFRGTDQLEYDLVVRPGGDPRSIRLRFDGPERLQITNDGDLQMDLEDVRVVHRAPRAYQDVGGNRTPIDSRFRMVGEDMVGFEVGSYDLGTTLTIDPIILVYSTFVGGAGWETPTRVTVDDAGMAYITGRTYSPDLLTSPGVLQTDWPGGVQTAYVMKIDPGLSGPSSLVYATYLGSSGDDVGEGIDVDDSGRAFVTGTTSAGDFPTTGDAYKPAFNPQPTDDHDAFIAVLSPSGDQLVYGSFWGGDRHDDGQDIVLNGADVIYLVGNTDGGSFPTTSSAFDQSGHPNSPFLSVLEWPTGTLRYSTVIHGSWLDYARALAVDQSGRAHVTGIARSDDFPTTANAFMGTVPPDISGGFGSLGAFYSVFDPDLTGTASLVYSTYLGAADAEDVAVDDVGNAYVVGTTASPTFPTTPGAYDTTCEDAMLDTGGEVINLGCVSDAFVMKIDPGQWGSASLRYATRLGGSWGESGLGITVDGSGSAFVTGSTGSPDFPERYPLEGSTGRTGLEGDAFVTKIAPYGNRLVFSTRLGGLSGPSGSSDEGTGIALAPDGGVCLTGYTRTTDFPIRGGFDATYNGSADAFFVKLRYDPCAELTTRIETGPFEWEQLPPERICLEWDTNPDGIFEGFPRRCPPTGCPECSPALDPSGPIGEPPEFLAAVYHSAAPVLGGGPPGIKGNDKYFQAAWSAVGQRLDAAKTARFFTASLKRETMAAATEASQSPKAAETARGLLLQSLNAMELDWRTPELRPHKVSAGQGAVDLQGMARVSPTKEMREGQLSLRVTPGLPAVPAGYRPGWPLATFHLEYDGSLPKNRLVEVDLYAGWLGFNQPGEIKVLQWDGSGFEDVTGGVKYRDGTIRTRLDLSHDYIIVQALPCFRWRFLWTQ